MISKPGAGLLFDIDGTLVDTDALHLKAFNQVFGPYGHHFDEARFKAELQGFSLAAIRQAFLSDLPEQQQIDVLDEKEAVFRDMARAELKPMAGLIALLDAADAASLPMVAVTNAPRANAEMMLEGLGIRSRFRAVILGDELEHGKPHPMPYLEGLKALGAKAELSVAFEDSRAGVQSASSAGIATVGIETSLTRDELMLAGATTTAKSYEDRALLDFIASRISGLQA